MRDPMCMAEHQRPPLGECTCDAYTRGEQYGREDERSHFQEAVWTFDRGWKQGRADMAAQIDAYLRDRMNAAITAARGGTE